MEKHKIFISGLPFSCTKEQLEELFKSHGTIKDVRLVTYRSGKPKVRQRRPQRPEGFTENSPFKRSDQLLIPSNSCQKFAVAVSPCVSAGSGICGVCR